MAAPLAWFGLNSKEDQKRGERFDTTRLTNCWMKSPKSRNRCVCVQGLEYLEPLERITVNHRIKILEKFNKIQGKNNFLIKTVTKENIYFAAELSGFFQRMFLGTMRPYTIRIYDYDENQTMEMRRRFPFLLERMDIFVPPSDLLGCIRQKFNLCYPKYHIKDTDGQIIAQIEGPPHRNGLSQKKLSYKVLSNDGRKQIGTIAKKYERLSNEDFVDSEVFGLNFPVDIDVRIKALLLGACFLINMMYYNK